MTIEEIAKIQPGDVIMNIATNKAQVVKSVDGTPDKGCVHWRDGGSTPTNPHLQSVDYVSLMRDRVVQYGNIKQDIANQVLLIQFCLKNSAPDAKVEITKDWWNVKENITNGI